MVRRIISGGQTGADQAGLEAAARLGIATDGHMPRGWRTEAGPRPDLAERYGMQEAATTAYPERTELNVLAADGAVIFGALTGGSGLTRELAERHSKPCLVIPASVAPDAAARELAEWLALHRIETLNVAGNRKSQPPGIGRLAIEALTLALRQSEGQTNSEPHKPRRAVRASGCSAA